MNAHTPGPWVASLGEYAFTNSGQRAITTETGEEEMPTHIAFVSPVVDRKRSTPYNAPDPERDANALLLAAAPDLLNACRLLLAYDGTDHEDIGRLALDYADAIQSAREAVAKATGDGA